MKKRIEPILRKIRVIDSAKLHTHNSGVCMGVRDTQVYSKKYISRKHSRTSLLVSCLIFSKKKTNRQHVFTTGIIHATPTDNM